MIQLQSEPGRGDSGRSSIGLALAVAVLALGCSDREPPSCPVGAPIEANLDVWVEAVRATRTASISGAQADFEPLLARMRLAPLPETADDDPLKLSSLQAAPMRRGGDMPFDWLLTTRFRNVAGAESLRVQLLRPVPGADDLYCALGDQLSHDKEMHEQPCLEPHEGAARTVAFEPLVAPDRDAIVVSDAGGWCGAGTSRGDRFATSYWGVEGNDLVRYLEAVTFEAWYESPAPPVEIHRGEIELSGTWPKVITVTETIECRPPDELQTEAADCEPAERSTRYRYENHRYAATEEASSIGPEPTGDATKETTQ